MTLIGRGTQRRRLPLPGGAGSVTLAWSAATDVGMRRRVNEDSAIIAPPVFAVADGMGGHAAGDLASDAVVQRLRTVFDGGSGSPAQVNQALALAARDIGELAGSNPLGAGTTATGAVLAVAGDTPVFLVFNVGDSRTYAFHEGVLTQVTRDHSVVQELVDSGLITPDEAETHPDSNVITRAVGFNEPPQVDFSGVAVLPGMRIMACSDGLTKEVRAARIAELLGEGRPAKATAAALVAAALEAGGRDNVTVVIVDVLAVQSAG